MRESIDLPHRSTACLQATGALVTAASGGTHTNLRLSSWVSIAARNVLGAVTEPANAVFNGGMLIQQMAKVSNVYTHGFDTPRICVSVCSYAHTDALPRMPSQGFNTTFSLVAFSGAPAA